VAGESVQTDMIFQTDGAGSRHSYDSVSLKFYVGRLSPDTAAVTG
jgi:hypothetical protein